MNDTISREAVADAINGIECTRHTTWYEFYQKVMTAVEKLPPAEPKKGKWIPVTNGRGGHECDQCHEYAPSYQTGKEHLSDFCPSCGAKMEGVDDE